VPEEQISLDELTVREDLTYEEYPIKIVETAERVTTSRVIKMCKVQWNRYSEAEATWEREDELRKSYPQLFEQAVQSRGRDSFKGGRICNIQNFRVFEIAKIDLIMP
jgi:hypothetical protein